MKKHGTTLLFLLVLALGAFLRFDRLTVIPPSLSHDETAIAYNAYSILKTGKDEYGKRLPVLFRSFDDYKLPGMVYSTVPAVFLFGLTEMSARIPSAVFGTLAIIVMYGIAIEILGNKRKLLIGTYVLDGALLPAFMLAVSPWHVNFSRQLFESNGAAFWFMLGTLFLLRSRRNYSQIVWAGLSYVISLYFYYSVRLVIPFVGLLYLIMYRKTVMKEWKTTLFAFIICFLTFLPLGLEMLSPGGLERISIVSVVNDPSYLKKRDEYVRILGPSPTLLNKIRYNRRVALVATVIENYGKNMSVHNLFVTGTGTYGALYPFEIILIVFGIFAITSLPPFVRLLLWTWLLTAMLPGAFSINQPNTLRTLLAAPAFSVFSGLGMFHALRTVSRYDTKWQVTVTIAVFTLMFFQAFPKFLYAYFVDNPTNNALSFGDGHKQMSTYVRANEGAYDRIYISGYYWRPYIFMLYWTSYDPTAYQQSGTREHFGKYAFTAASWDTNGIKFMEPSFDFSAIPDDGKTLFILSEPEFQLHRKNFRKIGDINGRHAREVFVAAVRI